MTQTRIWLAAFAALALLCLPPPVRAAEPITIGFSMALTGGLAVVGKSGFVALQIWAEDINAKGGLLGRPVKLVYYDDQSNPSNVPGIYAKLLDVDKVDLVISGYATTQIAPAMPAVMQHDMVFFGMFGLAVNSKFHYDKYFSILPAGPDPKRGLSQGFFAAAAAQSPKPATVAIIAADTEFSRNASDGARDNAAAAGFKVIYDRTYPPGSVDFTPIMRAIQATNADIVYVASYPSDTVGIVRAASEVDLKTKVFGGSMVGMGTAAMKTQLGPLLNGIVDVEWWAPAPTMMFAGTADFVEKYQAKAASEGVDLLGYFLPPFSYAEMQILAEAVEATQGLDQGKIARYIHAHSFHTIVGDIAFGPEGEWAAPRPVWLQYQHVQGNGLDQFRSTKTAVILSPDELKTGSLIYPYTEAKR